MFVIFMDLDITNFLSSCSFYPMDGSLSFMFKGCYVHMCVSASVLDQTYMKPLSAFYRWTNRMESMTEIEGFVNVGQVNGCHVTACTKIWQFLHPNCLTPASFASLRLPWQYQISQLQQVLCSNFLLPPAKPVPATLSHLFLPSVPVTGTWYKDRIKCSF